MGAASSCCLLLCWVVACLLAPVEFYDLGIPFRIHVHFCSIMFFFVPFCSFLFFPVLQCSFVKYRIDMLLMPTFSFGSTCASFAIVASPIELYAQVNAGIYVIVVGVVLLNFEYLNICPVQHAFPSHEIDEWRLSLSEREQHESARDGPSTDANFGRAAPGGSVVMDHMLRNGMWAPVETRIFHHIILVSSVVF